MPRGVSILVMNEIGTIVPGKKTSLLSPDHKAIDSTSLSNFYREIVRGIFLFVFFLFAWVCIRDLTDLEEDLVAIQI